jgi:hypothetical protein
MGANSRARKGAFRDGSVTYRDRTLAGLLALAHFYIHLPLAISFIAFTCAFFVLGSILSAFLQWILSDWIYVHSTPKLPWHP